MFSEVAQASRPEVEEKDRAASVAGPVNFAVASGFQIKTGAQRSLFRLLSSDGIVALALLAG